METGALRGREAEARINDRAVIDAARLVFAVHGPNAPVSAVASEAGVGIGSLYRRYPSKEALLQHLCLESMRQVAAVAERALGEPDPWEALTGFVRECVAFRAGAFGATIAGSIETSAEMRNAAGGGHELMTRLVERAQQRGVVRDDVTAVDIQLLLELFSRRRPGDGDAHERVLDIALDGLSTGGPRNALSTPSLSWKTYVARWDHR